MTLNLDQQIAAVSLWIRMARDRTGASPSSADADHSSLLRRLLSGLEPFPFVPPRRYSYPDYLLAAGKAVRVGETFEPVASLFGPDAYIVDQARWKLIERRANDTLLLEWPDEPGSRYELSRPDAQGFRTMQRTVGAVPPREDQ